MDTEELYVKGFNAGYLLAKHEPVLLQGIIKNLQPTAPFLEGLFSGKEQLEFEVSQRNLHELQHLRERSNSRDQELGRDT